MLSVMIFAIIITIVATAYLRSVVAQQRNALNYDQGTRAYYAAESGAQDALRGLKTVPERLATNKDNCQPWDPEASGSSDGVLGVDDTYGLSYSCQLVTVNSSVITGEVEPGGALNAMTKLEFKDSPVPAGPYDLIVKWSEQTQKNSSASQTDQNLAALHPREAGGKPLMPKIHRWLAGGDDSKKVHALLRLAVIAHPNGSFNRTNITQRLLYLNPTTVSNSTTLDQNAGVETQQEQLFTNVKCYRSDEVPSNEDYGSYSCKATLRLMNYDFNSQTVYLRVGSVYNSTKFSLELVSTTAGSLPLKNSQVTIDVTGKSGENTFRRVQQVYDLQNTYKDTQPDAALIAGEGICKLYSIGTTAQSYSGGCNPLE